MLYLDEFQDFLNLPIAPADMFAQARSLGLAMTVAHQHIGQLSKELQEATQTNARSTVVFQTSADNAKHFARQFGRNVTDEDFMNQGRFEVIMRLATSAGVSPPATARSFPPVDTTGIAERVRQLSRKSYGRPIADVEREIAQRRGAKVKAKRSTKQGRSVERGDIAELSTADCRHDIDQEGEAVSAPIVRRRRLGAKLRGLREDHGLTLEEVAEKSEGRVTVAKLSRLELAKSAAKAEDFEHLLGLYGAVDDELRGALLALTREGAQRGWWHSYRGVLSPVYEDLISLEPEAASVQTWQTSTVPGLLQTAEYAREMITSTATSEAMAEHVFALVEIRLARQSVLTRHDPLVLTAIIGEPALRMRTADPSVMYEQLSRLLRMAELPNITVQVVPMSAPPHVGQTGSYSVLGFGGHKDLDVVHLESLTNALYVEDAQQVNTYQQAFERLQAVALPVEQSLALISEARDRK